jgi:hypothetical protein
MFEETENPFENDRLEQLFNQNLEMEYTHSYEPNYAMPRPYQEPSFYQHFEDSPYYSKHTTTHELKKESNSSLIWIIIAVVLGLFGYYVIKENWHDKIKPWLQKNLL